MDVTIDNITRFRTLFSGYDGAHGRFEVQYEKENGKMEGKASTFRHTPTETEWREHLKGERVGLGIIPLRRDNTVLFAALDIDDRRIDFPKLEANCKDLPVVICRSKSGGAHVYLFLKEPAPAKRIVPILTRWAALLGYGGCEIFPKQTSRASERDVGNWINLPYYRGNETERYAMIDGRKLTFEEFLDYAESRRVTLPDEAHIPGALPANNEDESASYYEAPPCLQHLAAAGGFPEGTRNDGLYNVAVYLKKRYPDSWENRLQEYNLLMCKPPITLNELADIAKSVKRKSYAYRCSQSPIKPHCDRRACLGRRFGVGQTADAAGAVEISGITKYEGDPVYWVVELGGERVEMNTDDLFNQGAFARHCMNTINRCPPQMPSARWHAYLDSMLRGAPSIPAPEDASKVGQLWIIIDGYCFGRLQAKHEDEMIQGKPWQSQGRVYFRSAALFEYLKIKKFYYDSEHWVWNRLREGGGQSKQAWLKERNINVWSLPIPNTPELQSLRELGKDAPLPDALGVPGEPGARSNEQFDFSDGEQEDAGSEEAPF